MSDNFDLILASGSRYRRAQLERLGLPFSTSTSEVDETPLPGESVQALVLRLAQAKAAAVGAGATSALVIGSDQAACIAGEQTDTDRILGKPGTAERAREQLARLSGRSVHFYTSVCLLDTASSRRWEGTDETVVHFRELNAGEIAELRGAGQSPRLRRRLQVRGAGGRPVPRNRIP